LQLASHGLAENGWPLALGLEAVFHRCHSDSETLKVGPFRICSDNAHSGIERLPMRVDTPASAAS